MQCSYFDAHACRSCTLIELPYADQVRGKEERCAELLGGGPGLQWLPTVRSREDGYRNKAKMVVGGTVEQPTLGILDAGGRGVDLRSCPVVAEGIRAVLPHVARVVTRAGLTPYDVPRRRGELKHVLITESPAGELMVRFVLRSDRALPRLREHLPRLLQEAPAVAVVTANLLPEHKAVLEGDVEVALTERTTLPMPLGAVELDLRPRSFFQTNTDVATALYAQVRQWVDEVTPASVWDLYCGVGGFALHCAAPGRRVVGIEVSAEAVESARLAARDLPGSSSPPVTRRPSRSRRRTCRTSSSSTRPAAASAPSWRGGWNAPASGTSSTPAATPRRSPPTCARCPRCARCGRGSSTCSPTPRTSRSRSCSRAEGAGSDGKHSPPRRVGVSSRELCVALW